MITVGLIKINVHILAFKFGNFDQHDILLVCAWEDQSENQYFIYHKVSSVLYSKYNTVVKKYSTVILIIICINNPP